MSDRRTATTSRTERRTPVSHLMVSVVVAFIVGVLLQLAVTREPDRITRMTFVNPTSHQIVIHARPSSSSSRTPVAIVGPNKTVSTGPVIDQGEVWIFDFIANGRPAGSEEVPAASLRQGGWTYTLPTSISDELRAGQDTAR